MSPSGTIISIAYDHVEPSRYPEKWNLPITYLISSVLGGVACASSIWLLALVLDRCAKNPPFGGVPWHPFKDSPFWRLPSLSRFPLCKCFPGAAALRSHNMNSVWYKGWGLPMLTYGNVVCALYQKVSLSDFLTLFSARTVGPFFSQARASAHPSRERTVANEPARSEQKLGVPVVRSFYLLPWSIAESLLCDRCQTPAKPLMFAAVFAMGCSTILAALWPFNEEKVRIETHLKPLFHCSDCFTFPSTMSSYIFCRYASLGWNHSLPLPSPAPA